MARPPNLFLVGPPACGKTTLGKRLAERLGREFFDSDDAVQQRTGRTIAEIFELEGEERFREYEAEMIERLTSKNNIVLATGGGAVLAENNRRLLNDRGTVVYLQADVDTQLARIAESGERPLLKKRDKRATLEELARRRESRYREIADMIIDVNDKSVRDAADEIVAACQRHL